MRNRTPLVLAVATVALSLVGGAAWYLLRDEPAPRRVESTFQTPVPTPDGTADYVKKVATDWRVLDDAWSAKLDTDPLITEENLRKVRAMSESVDNARKLEKTLHKLEPVPRRASLLHRKLKAFVRSVVEWGAATDRIEAIGPSRDEDAVKRRANAAADRDAALEWIRDLLPEVQLIYGNLTVRLAESGTSPVP